MKKYYFLTLALLFCLQGSNLYSKSNEKSHNAPSKSAVDAARKTIDAQPSGDTFVTIYTSQGAIEVMLYDQTPLHKANFVRLAQSGDYSGMLFHRVIKEFMVQSGDPLSKETLSTARYGANNVGENIDAEIVSDFFHHKGALAAARTGDQMNPERRSSGSQFYIVHGKTQTDSTLNAAVERGGTKQTPERAEVYKTIGGAPHLDGQYTIFGRVTRGRKTVDKIANMPTDRSDRPVKDVFIKKMVVRIEKKK